MKFGVGLPNRGVWGFAGESGAGGEEGGGVGLRLGVCGRRWRWWMSFPSGWWGWRG